MNKILNLTQHTATAEQKEMGVVDPINKDVVQTILTFQEIPTKKEIASSAIKLTGIAIKNGHDTAMIGGAPWLMGTLEICLKLANIKPVYSFSKRQSVEEHNADGSVQKIQVFRHIGFVEV